jgi:predicted kinase
MPPRLIVLVGLPGSGKSHWASHQGPTVLSSDEIRRLLSDDPNNQSINGSVFATLRYLLRRRLELQAPVTYIDATNLTPKERRPYIVTAQMYGGTAEAVYFDTPPEECKRRNRGRDRVVPDEVIDSMAARLRVPTQDEGFTRVTVISPDDPPKPV